MKPAAIMVAYLALAALDLAWSLFLLALNYRKAALGSAEVPAEFRGLVTPEQHAKASAYSMARMRLAFIETPLSAAAMAALAVSGCFGLLDGLAGTWTASPYWRAALFLALSAELLGLPFSAYSTFVLERKFAFSTTTFRTWVLDGAKGLILGAALGLPLLKLLFAFMDAAGGLWWLWAAAAFSLVEVILSLLYPLVIAPLFNKFTPLGESGLAGKIRAMAARLGFRMSGIFVMDGSRRSRHSNAYFTGFGRARRVILYDTLVSGLAEEEVLAVLAHEIGHAKKRHVLKMTAVSTAASFFGFGALSLLMGWPELYAAFGFAGMTKEAILLIFALVSGPATFFMTPIFSAWSRRHEYEADRFSIQAAGGEHLASALLRLNLDNASNLCPHPLYSAWYYSHPTLSERLAAIRRS